MASFRFAVALGDYAERLNKFVRPAMPKWMTAQENRGKNSSRYWTKIYWATPPWINDEQVAEMKRLHDTCPEGSELDHITPLRSPLVCGLHVPWNMQHLTTLENQLKSNKVWPGHPFGYDLPSTQGELF